jgi:hypothetical protein
MRRLWFKNTSLLGFIFWHAKVRKCIIYIINETADLVRSASAIGCFTIRALSCSLFFLQLFKRRRNSVAKAYEHIANYVILIFLMWISSGTSIQERIYNMIYKCCKAMLAPIYLHSVDRSIDIIHSKDSTKIGFECLLVVRKCRLGC